MSNFNCTQVSTAYNEYKEPLCNDVKNGFVELLALRVLSLPLEIGLCFLGIRFVLRNKVDVPQYVKPKPKKAKKKDSDAAKAVNSQGDEAGEDDDEATDGDEEGEDGRKAPLMSSK